MTETEQFDTWAEALGTNEECKCGGDAQYTEMGRMTIQEDDDTRVVEFHVHIQCDENPRHFAYETLERTIYRRSRASASGLDPEGEARHHA